MIRLIQIAAIALLAWMAYKALRRFMAGGAEAQARRKRQSRGEVMDVMVQDPQCGTYLPKHEALSAWVRGEEKFFCSKQCRDAYVKTQGKGAK